MASNGFEQLAYPPVGGVNIIRATHAIKASYLDPFHKACSSTVKHLVNHLFRGDGVTLGPKAPKLRWIARPDEFFISVSATIVQSSGRYHRRSVCFRRLSRPQQDTSSCCART